MNLKSRVCFGFLYIGDYYFILAFNDKENYLERVYFKKNEDRTYSILKKLLEVESVLDKKIYAMEVSNSSFAKDIKSRLWLDFDIVPFLFEGILAEPSSKDIFNRIRLLSLRFNSLLEKKITKNKFLEVDCKPLLCSANDYFKIVPDSKFSAVINYSDFFKVSEISFLFLSSTLRGGGVSLMRHSLVRFFQDLGVDCRWAVLEGDKEIFEITKKKFHNVLQGVNVDTELDFTQKDISLLENWSEKNYGLVKKSLDDVDFVIVDDYQPSGLIPMIKRDFPDIKIIYRSHIQIRDGFLDDDIDSIHDKVWDYLYDKIQFCDCFVSHPVLNFVPKPVDISKRVFFPASTDPLDGLNKSIDKRYDSFYFDIFDSILDRFSQKPLDREREYIVQVARFDPSKGIFDLLEAYRKLRFELGPDYSPQLLLVGNGALDDPEGLEIFNEVLNRISKEDFSFIKDDIKVAVVPHIDQLLNVLLRNAYVATQLSYNEGFEVKVSESLWKGVPIVVYDGTGAKLQVKNNIDGFVVKNRDIDGVALRLYKLFKDKRMYIDMCKNARNVNYRDYTTVDNALNWLEILFEISKKDIMK